jgi:ATP-dependent RNA helicase DDX27
MGKTRYLILQPTRELAVQCHSMLANLSKYVNTFTSSVIVGGSSMMQQKRELEEEPDLIVATTGRLLDHLHNTKGFTLEHVQVLVLDEADKLVEMGFKDEVMEIIRSCGSAKRQTLMVSATLNQDIKELAKLALKEPL